MNFWEHVPTNGAEAFMTLNGWLVLFIGAPVLIIVTVIAYLSRSK